MAADGTFAVGGRHWPAAATAEAVVAFPVEELRRPARERKQAVVDAAHEVVEVADLVAIGIDLDDIVDLHGEAGIAVPAAHVLFPADLPAVLRQVAVAQHTGGPRAQVHHQLAAAEHDVEGAVARIRRCGLQVEHESEVLDWT